jgi:hypothetical protein
MQSMNRRSLLSISLATGVGIGLFVSGRILLSTWTSRFVHPQDRPNANVELKRP